MSELVLSGDSNVLAMPLSDSEVNHLRRLLAWMRTEYMICEHMQRGAVEGALAVVESYPHLAETASAVLGDMAAEANKVPRYVRQGVKMLTKKLLAHDTQSGIVEGHKQ
jgi:hypothetical protein